MWLSACLDVVSHTIKEALVRSQPLNQETFNFQIGLFQLFVGLLLLPFIKMTQGRNGVDSPFYGEYFDHLNVFAYAGQYAKYGLMCAFSIDQGSLDHKFTNDGECHNSWVFILGYTASLFVIQLTLISIMTHKFTRYAQILQSFMVPISFVAFFLASKTVPVLSEVHSGFTKWDIWGLLIVGVGVFMQNWFKERPQISSIEDDV